MWYLRLSVWLTSLSVTVSGSTHVAANSMVSLLSKWLNSVLFLGFPEGLVSKESTCNAEDLGLIPGSGRSPGERNGNPLQYSCLENPMDKGAWRVTVLGSQRVKHSWVTNTHSIPMCVCVYIHLIFFIYSAVSGHLDCFCVSFIVSEPWGTCIFSNYRFHLFQIYAQEWDC